MRWILPLVSIAALIAAAGCGSSSSGGGCDLVTRTGCDGGLVCEATPSGGACVEPVVIQGTVTDLQTAAPLAGARVVGLDANRSPLASVAVTPTTAAAPGSYAFPVRADRDAAGAPLRAFVTLRADAQGYQTFPGGIRAALPIDLSTATHDAANKRWVVQGTLTGVKLLALTGGGTAWVHGSVAQPPGGVGALVVAEPAPGGAGPATGTTGIADAAGNYAIFNLAAGTSYVVTSYAMGANYTPVTTAALAAGDNAVAAIALGAGAGASFSGGLIFNNGAAGPVGVALVVESTYVATLDRGETPPGLAVQGDANKGYAFTGVPDGKYRALAASGIDGAVRDISGGGNTAAPQITVQNGALVTAVPNFKIKPAVHLLTVDGQAVGATPILSASATPVFAWQKESAYSSASTYRLAVYDAFGTAVWGPVDMAAPATPGASATYAGAALAHGMTYQLRIQALAEAIPVPATPTVLSYTEDLLGLFTY